MLAGLDERKRPERRIQDGPGLNAWQYSTTVTTVANERGGWKEDVRPVKSRQLAFIDAFRTTPVGKRKLNHTTHPSNINPS